jgi:hypothetical protein
MSNMIRFLMTDVVTDEKCERAEVLIKTFLSRVHRVNKALHDHLLDYVPIWIKKSNFMGLLNLPKMMRAGGGIRLHWEWGGRKGDPGFKKKWWINSGDMGLSGPFEIIAVEITQQNPTDRSWNDEGCDQ